MTSRPEMGGFLFEEGREPETWAGPTPEPGAAGAGHAGGAGETGAA